MKKYFLLAILIAAVCFCNGQTIDPEYLKTFGEKTIVISGKGLPAPEKFDASMYNFKDGKSFISAGPDQTIDLMALLPAGMDIGKLVEKLKKDKPQNMKYYKYSFISWRVWCSHNSGQVWYTDELPWPKSISDIPNFSDAKEIQYDFDPAKHATIAAPQLTWVQGGSNLLSSFSGFDNATPGIKYYVIFSVAYVYQASSGQIENKWDPIRKEYLPQKSTGALGYVYSDPIAVATIEIDQFKEAFKQFSYPERNEVTDNSTGFTWDLFNVSRSYTQADAMKEYDNSPDSKWRLPSPAELKTIMDLSLKNDPNKCCRWLVAKGFETIWTSKYWTNETNGTEATVADFEKMEFVKVPVTEICYCFLIKK